jgi:raffinose/stachyose/melibiose transport system substrate-binding protein
MFHKRLGKAIAVLATTGVALGLAACSGGGDRQAGQGDSQTLTVWWYEAPESAMGTSWQQALEAFEAEHPDVTVKFEQKTWDQIQKSGQMILNSGNVPDVMEYAKGRATAGAVASTGLLTDLTDVATERGWLDKLPSSVQTVGRYDENGLMGDGPLYGVPTYGEYVSVFFNKDMLAERGLQPPASIGEFESVMQAFVDDGITPLALGSGDYPIVHLVYELALNKADEDWVRALQFFDGDMDFHDEAWTFAAQTVADWVDKGYIAPDSTGIDAANAAQGFQAGTYPFMVSGSWFGGEFKKNITDFEWGTFPFPGNNLTAGSGGNIFVVPENARNKELAYEFIDLALGQEAQDTMGNHGGVPVAANPEAVTDPVGQMTAADFAAILEQDGLAYYPDWPIPGYYDVLLAESQNLVTGVSTPEKFLDAIGAAYEAGKAGVTTD